MSFGTRDETAPLTVITTGGMDVAAGAEVEIIAASSVDPTTGLPARIKVTVCHNGTVGTTDRIRLGLGATATSDTGLYLDPGDVFEEFTAVAIRVRNTGDDSVRVTWIEWGA